MQVCETCGQEHKTCKAHKRGSIKAGDPQPCNQRLGRGKTVCHFHGGSARQVDDAADERNQKQEARQVLATYGEPIPTDPVQGFYDLISWTAGHVDWLRQRVRALEANDLVWGDSEVVDDDGKGTRVTQKAGTNVWVKLYSEERDKLADLFATAIKIGLEERRIRLAEQTGRRFVALLDTASHHLFRGLVAAGWDEGELAEEWDRIFNAAIHEAITSSEPAIQGELVGGSSV